MTSFEIMSIEAYIYRKGHKMSLWEFDQMIENERVLPRGESLFYQDLFFLVSMDDLSQAEKQRVTNGPRGFWNPPGEEPEDHPTAIELLDDLALCHFSFSGGGVSFEVENAGMVDVFDPDDYSRNGEIPQGYFRDFTGAIFEQFDRIDTSEIYPQVNLMFLLGYDGGKDPDTVDGPGEYWSECSVVGRVTQAHLRAIAKMIQEEDLTKTQP